MFELISGARRGSPHRTAWPMIVSTVAHVAIVGAVVLIPLLYMTDQLPAVPHMMAFVAAPPEPPLPPPPPPAPRVAAAQTRRPIATAGRFSAPLEAPSRVEAEAGIEQGVEGGVAGGIEGGVPGGVLGGIVGGIPSDIPPPPPPPPPVRQPIRVGGQLQAPALLKRAAPRYPELQESEQHGDAMTVQGADLDSDRQARCLDAGPNFGSGACVRRGGAEARRFLDQVISATLRPCVDPRFRTRGGRTYSAGTEVPAYDQLPADRSIQCA